MATPDVTALHALCRFGLGPAIGDIEMVQKTGVEKWLLSQLGHTAAPSELSHLVHPDVSNLSDFFKKMKDGKKNKEDKDKDIKDPEGNPLRKTYIKDTGARFSAQIGSPTPFIERLVMFWSNHFTVSIRKNALLGLVNIYEVQAIRPYINATFRDMLGAVIKHPAMLIYLDNQKSAGADSRVGRRAGKNINENLARELLELHTLGVNGGYTQDDVIALAKIITGWSVGGLGDAPDDDGKPFGFQFRPQLHEPGAKSLLGKTYREDGQQEGEKALDDLARHPSTARFIATKLARHFIADDPPQSAIDRLTRVFLNTNGSLAAINKELIAMPECWAQPMVKFKTPYEFALSSFRLLNLDPEPRQTLAALSMMNYRVFDAASPAGYADNAATWATGDALLKRVEWSKAIARRIESRTNPKDLAEQAFGPVMRDETRFIIAGAETAIDGISFVLSSPEFQRR